MKDEVLGESLETRKSDVHKRASRLVGVADALPRYTPSNVLPRGAQAKLVHACCFSQHIRRPINTLTTINSAHLQRTGEGGVFAVGHLWDGMRRLLDLMRRWHDSRSLGWAAVWSREVAAKTAIHPGEHWHIGHYLPREHHTAWFRQVATWTGEDHDTAHVSDALGSAARSLHGAYLGKAEPNQIKLYRTSRPNPNKYDPRKSGGKGYIEGQRFGLSREVSHKAQVSVGFTARCRGPLLF